MIHAAALKVDIKMVECLFSLGATADFPDSEVCLLSLCNVLHVMSILMFVARRNRIDVVTVSRSFRNGSIFSIERS